MRDSQTLGLLTCSARGRNAGIQGRVQLLKEAEERSISKVTWEKTPTNPSEDSRLFLPGCTTEGINYVLECSTCRDKGVKRQYWG